jgi:hypothetical protein
MHHGANLGAGLGAISHGICPRHFKKLASALELKPDAGHPAPARAAPARRRRAVVNHPELNYPA